ncbi:hypothetical protein Sango_2218900 [Sesamum angolense]|uniref:4Fe-4S ferredoxin-type domain-containing protein n=1 Tax=Sesamum angolense TaxID=2727404 RepID=A0AAE2BKM9_9LAMI|nr:hypothetical protein Sango_2218900 [Sesamum angolense]
MARLLLSALVLLMVALSDGAPNKPKKVKCDDHKFPDCLRKDLYCPDACPQHCKANCTTCQPVCVPPPHPPKPHKVKCKDKNYKKTCNKQLYCPADCPQTCIADCPTCQAVCPSPSYSPPPPVVTPSPPATAPTPPPPTNSTPSSPPSPSYTPPPATPSPSPDSSEAAGGKRVRCKNSPVCDCNKPGAVCQDPRFIGADGITFYFHGKKDRDFCIVSDTNLHINAHFIGRRNENMGRDFTWVQSLGILFGNHQIFVGAKKTATWDNAVDRLELSFDGLPVYLAEGEGAKWRPTSDTGITITRSRDTNAVVIEVDGNFQIKAAIIPITAEDSRIHKYGITDEDCFAHLDLGFKFYSLSVK